MTYAHYFLAFIILTPVFVVSFARWFKRHIDRNYPSVDRDGEIEALLADGLALEFSHPGSLSPLLIDG
jgi:dolichyl-phosphate-mannose--protein O-mannosyl transferase